MSVEDASLVEFNDSSETDNSVEKDSLDRELDRIRLRRTDKDKKFPKTFDDVVLIFGVIAGIVFFGGVTLLSSGMFAGDSILIDQTLSKTPLDTGGECRDMQGELWYQIYSEHLEIFVETHNARDEKSSVLVVRFTDLNESDIGEVHYQSGQGDIDISFTLSDEINPGDFLLIVSFYQGDYDSELSVTNSTTFSEVSEKLKMVGNEKIVDLEVTTHSSIYISDPDPRACFTMEILGGWGWILMAAEWAGGRETAMLTGGSASVPAWWMAFISLGMSIFFLCVQYPLMHRMYHRDTDDLLTDKQLRRLIERTLRKSENDQRITIKFEEMKMQERAISIDVIIPYNTTNKTIGQATDIRAAFTRDLLEEFAVFGEMRPLQIKSISLDGINLNQNPEFILSSNLSIIGSERSILSEDYSSFFSGLSANGKLEDETIHFLNKWFKTNNLIDYGSAIIVDDESVLIRVIYTPIMRFSYFFYRKSFVDMQEDLTDYLSEVLAKNLGPRELIISARNEKATLSDRALAGRVELGSNQDDLVGE
ncbi:MAG: hypothetical protein HOH07_07125, partial [Euryarchaeota archaeon]|nr:hypothetical protein [Euryarchaeota archaeon]